MAHGAIENARQNRPGAAADRCGRWQKHGRIVAQPSTGRGRHTTATARGAALRGFSRDSVRAVGAGPAIPYESTRVERLLAEGLVHPGADAELLRQPVHAERVEYLLTVCAMALTKRDAATVAPWSKPRGFKKVFGMLKQMKAWGQSGNS